MKKRVIIFIVLFVLIAIVVLGCKKNQVNTNNLTNQNSINNQKTHNYMLQEIDFTNEMDDLKQIIFFDMYDLLIVYNEDGLYRYSEKKYSNETHWKKYDFNFDKYKFVGKDGNELLFMANNKNIALVNLYLNINDRVEVYTDFRRDYVEMFWKKYNLNLFYNESLYEIYDNKIVVNNNEVVDIPNGDTISNYYYINSNIDVNGTLYLNNIFLSKSGNYYYIGIDKDDKCNEYSDIVCKKVLIKIDLFKEILSDYRNNIKFFNGRYLITNSNKMYLVKYNI